MASNQKPICSHTHILVPWSVVAAVSLVSCQQMWLCLISALEMGEKTEPVCVPLYSVLCDPGSLFTLLPVHLQPPSCSTVCVPLTGFIPPVTWAPFPTQHLTWGIFWGHDNEWAQRTAQTIICSHPQSLPLIHSEDTFQNFLTVLTSMEFYRNICQFPALSAFCSCTSLSVGLMQMFRHSVVSPSVFVQLSCAPVLWTGWHRAGLTAGLGFGHSLAALSKERRASPVRTYGRSPPKPSPFPQLHVEQNFGGKSHHKAEGPLPYWLTHPWRYDFAQQHLVTSRKFLWLFSCFWQAKGIFFAGELLGIPVFPLENVSLELPSLFPLQCLAQLYLVTR